MYYSALIGNPTEHSVSHLLYEELLKAAGIEDAYKHIKIDVTTERLKEAITALRELKFCGISVTLPHKLDVMQYLNEIDEPAIQLGAVNTIKPESLKGYNTDWVGIVKPLNKLLGTDLLTGEATIFGTGGAARAAIYAAKQLQASKINVVYRADANDPKTEDLIQKAEVLGIELYPYQSVPELVQRSKLIFNATSAGMVGKDDTPFDLNDLAELNLNDKVYFDAVFNPIATPLLTYFNERGSQTIDGLWMMIYQGIEALSIWLNMKITIEESQLDTIHETLIKELSHV